MAEMITEVSVLVSAATGWVAQWVNQITETPLLMMGFIVSLVGLGVGLLRRLINIR